MKKFLGLIISSVLCLTLVMSFVGCSNDNNDGDQASETKTGVIYSVKKDDDGNAYAIVEKYVLSEEKAKLVANDDYAAAMESLRINVYTDDDGNEIPVKEIAASAFANQLIIKSIEFGPNVETFGLACLAGCANLESLTVPFVGKTVDAVNDGKVLGYLFGTASSDGSSSVTMSYNATGSKSFYIPDSLKTVKVTGDVLSDYAFYGLNLTTVELTGEVETIGDYAFYGMMSLTSYAIPASVKKIGKYAFSECANLTSIDLSKAEGLETIGEHAFDCCDLLGYGKDYELVLPASVTTLGAKAFYNCGSLKKVDLSASQVNALGEYTFYACESLEEIKLKENTSLALGVFVGCDKLDRNAVQNIAEGTDLDLAFGPQEQQEQE